MFSESDLDDAVAAGVLSPASAAAFRDYIAGGQASPLVDEEHFRLVSGFNDIFVSIAALLLLVAVAWIGQSTGVGMRYGPSPLAGIFVAIAAWGLAEFFTRKRRMALPSIVLLLAFVGSVFVAAAAILVPSANAHSQGSLMAIPIALSAAIAAAAAWAHWRRFQVPITIAAGTAGLVGVVVALVVSAVPPSSDGIYGIALLCGVAVFAFAMWWDMADPARRTRRSDVAFWLHLLAAPLIVHPVFALMGLLNGGASVGKAAIVVLLYIAMGVVALAVDRRALLVSALAYVLYALSTLFREFGAVSLNLALTGFVIGSALLLLSAFWHGVRSWVVSLLPEEWRRRLPGIAAPLMEQPAS